MYFHKRYIRQKSAKLLLITLFSVTALSGCDKEKTPPEQAPAPITTQVNPNCRDLSDALEATNYERYPEWTKNSQANSSTLRSEEELANIEKNHGKTLNYYSLALVIQAQKTTQLVAQEKFSSQEATQRLAEFDALAATARECYKAEPPVSGASLIHYSFLLDAVGKYDQSVRERIELQDKNAPHSDTQKAKANSLGEWMVKGSADKVIRKYNAIIENYNQTR